MTREIKFRGKVLEDNEELELMGVKIENGWVTGNLIQNGSNPVIVGDVVEINDEYLNLGWWVSVTPETVSQHTGLKDKNGVEIYEGDILNYGEYLNSHVVVFRNGCFWGQSIEHVEPIGIGLYNALEDLEVIGNKFDNFELLEG